MPNSTSSEYIKCLGLLYSLQLLGTVVKAMLLFFPLQEELNSEIINNIGRSGPGRFFDIRVLAFHLVSKLDLEGC